MAHQAPLSAHPAGLAASRYHASRRIARIARLFVMAGLFLSACGALLCLWAFGTDIGPADWVLMHRSKLELGLGIGLAGIGALFLCSGMLGAALGEGLAE